MVEVSFFLLRRATVRDIVQIGVVIFVNRAVKFAAVFAFCFSPASRRAAGMVGKHLFAIVADVIFVHVLVVGDRLFAKVTNMIFVRVVVQAHISALAAHAVRPLMRFARHNYSTAAAPLLFVGSCRLCCPLRRTLVVGGVFLAVGPVAEVAGCLGFTGRRAAGVLAVSILL